MLLLKTQVIFNLLMNSKLNKLLHFYTLKYGSYIYTVKRPVCYTHNWEVIVMFWKKNM